MEQHTVRKTFKEKLRPTPAQERVLDEVLWRCRTLYNTALEQRIIAWQRSRVSVSRFEQEAELKAVRAAFPEYEAIHSHVLQDVLARLDKTYQAFFRRLQRGRKPDSHASRAAIASTPSPSRSMATAHGSTTAISLCRRSAGLPFIGAARLQGRPRRSRSLNEADGWYVSISCAEVPTHPLPTTGQETGIDLGIEAFATLADGTRILTPGCYRKAERYLAKCQRRMSRRKKGSHRRRRAVDLLAKAHQTVRRQRQDFHHKTALALVRENDTIYHEELRVANMVRNHHLAKSIADAGWGAFLTILAFKAESAGKQVIGVDPAFTSQTCSGCGVLVAKGLSVRWHNCPDCGASLHRDHNAARNIQWRGQRLRGLAG